ncbi:hypothetical protein RvY_05424-2 [Ramazzottius varieornatus]|uniref:Uncharacterized protein n=1 Tax=Ramazzottius varieornatus TaxID=947166 RepID=A0A1D1UY11_RAMVA|nr:hypothetical protein RvY_05424-2 [Ramazzottius varieornatus]
MRYLPPHSEKNEIPILYRMCVGGRRKRECRIMTTANLRVVDALDPGADRTSKLQTVPVSIHFVDLRTLHGRLEQVVCRRYVRKHCRREESARCWRRQLGSALRGWRRC